MINWISTCKPSVVRFTVIDVKRFLVFPPENHRCYMVPEENHFQQQMPIEEELVEEIENVQTFIFYFYLTLNVHRMISYNVSKDIINVKKIAFGNKEHIID